MTDVITPEIRDKYSAYQSALLGGVDSSRVDFLREEWISAIRDRLSFIGVVVSSPPPVRGVTNHYRTLVVLYREAVSLSRMISRVKKDMRSSRGAK